MARKATKTIKISEETKKILDDIKKTEGIEIMFMVDKAVKEYYKNTIKKYIQEQEIEDRVQDKRSIKEYKDPFNG